MTDTAARLAGELSARDLVDRTSFQKESIWLPLLAVQHWNAGQMTIDGKTFTDCLIEGPGVLAVMNGTHFDSCAMGATSEISSLFYKPASRTRMAGVIGMSNCTFLRCRFVQIGFTGSVELVDEMIAGITPVSQLSPERPA